MSAMAFRGRSRSHLRRRDPDAVKKAKAALDALDPSEVAAALRRFISLSPGVDLEWLEFELGSRVAIGDDLVEAALEPANPHFGTTVRMIHEMTVRWAIRELVERRLDECANLKVNSGEHLAAILLTALLFRAPDQFDVDGGVDLIFPAVDDSGEETGESAFEVKSLDNGFRKFAAIAERTPPGDPRRNRQMVVVSADQLLTLSVDTLKRIDRSLRRKVSGDVSRNAFVIAHRLDYPVAEEHYSQLIAGHLSEIEELDRFDSVWLLFHPWALALWDRENGWQSMMVQWSDDDDESNSGWDSPLQAIESAFLTALGVDDSPFLY
jgi:hypothetical protein